MNISKRLKSLRKIKKVTQKAVAEFLHITEVSYQRYEYGTVRPSLDVLIALADYFDVPLDYLVGRGIFANWEEIIENKAFIFPILQGELPFLKGINLDELEEKTLMRILPTMIQKVDISGEGDAKKIEVTLYPFYLN